MLDFSGCSERPAQTWIEHSARRWLGLDRPASRMSKLALKDALTRFGLPHLHSHQIFDRAADICLDAAPDLCVLKPSALWSSTGVMVLQRLVGGRWHEALSGQILTSEKVVESCRQLEAKLGKSLHFLLEERAVDEDPQVAIAFDYKIYAFHGVTKFVLQVDRTSHPQKFAFFDGAFEPILDDRVQASRAGYKLAPHRRPSCWRELLTLASDVSVALEAPFVSVDCYATTRGAVVGELTHTPGAPWFGTMFSFSEGFDLELGAAWSDANDRLGRAPAMIPVPCEVSTKGRVVRRIA